MRAHILPVRPDLSCLSDIASLLCMVRPSAPIPAPFAHHQSHNATQRRMCTGAGVADLNVAGESHAKAAFDNTNRDGIDRSTTSPRLSSQDRVGDVTQAAVKSAQAAPQCGSQCDPSMTATDAAWRRPRLSSF